MMLTDHDKIDLIWELIGISEEQSAGSNALTETVKAAYEQWDKLEDALKAFPKLKPGETPHPNHEITLHSLEGAQLVTVIGEQLLREIGHEPRNSEETLRSVCNMLGIDYFGDLRETTPNGCNWNGHGFEP